MALDWQTASRESSNIAPLAHLTEEAQVHIYAAKAFSWRGKFSLHTWLATKEKDADSYIVYHVLLWGTYYGDSVVVIQKDLPDRYWYGARPDMIFCASGKKAEAMIPQIYESVNSYPYQKFYRAYPGPNSNTFVSHVIRSVKGFNMSLPNNAIGKDWLCGKKFFAISESGTGLQFSLYAMLGIIVGFREGIEINIIGLSFGIDFLRPALKLPMLGRFGMKK